MELRHVGASRKRFAAASLCCLLFLGAAGAGTEKKDEDPCLKAVPHPPTDEFELVPQQFSPAAPQFDPNNLMLNPQWGFQVKNAPKPGATPTGANYPDSLDDEVCANACFKDCAGPRQPTTMDRPAGCFMCNLAEERPSRKVGHVNWFAATYTGTVCFHNCSYPDMDFTFSLVTNKGAGLTRWNHPNDPDKQRKLPAGQVPAPLAMHIELDSRESINRFRSPIWSDFDSKAAPWEAKDVGVPGKNSRDLEGAKKMIERRRAVVIGLVGLDSAHTVYSELHPVYAMAIEMNADPADNTWIVFARNRGNEGACAVEDHPLTCPQGGGDTLKRLTLLIPPPKGTTGVPTVVRTAGTQFYGNTPSCPQLSYFLNPDARYTEDNQGVLVSFDLGDCAGEDCLSLVEGEIHLKWTGDFPPPEKPPASPKNDDRHLDACIIREEGAKGMKGEDDEGHKLGKPSSQQAARLISVLVQERAQFVSQMTLCPRVGEVAIVQGPPPAAVCGTFDPLASFGGPRPTRVGPSQRVSDLRRKIEEILGKKPDDK